MYLLIIFLPLLGSLIAGLFGRFIGVSGAVRITTLCIIVSAFISYFCFYEVAFFNSPCYITLLTWIDSEMFSLSWGFLFDTLTCVMLVVVITVSTFVHLYSIFLIKYILLQ